MRECLVSVLMVCRPESAAHSLARNIRRTILSKEQGRKRSISHQCKHACMSYFVVLSLIGQLKSLPMPEENKKKAGCTEWTFRHDWLTARNASLTVVLPADVDFFGG